ncbi:error-prone DNA polymerase [Sabulicella glaciei]|uniref:Error-prone DNA polymerase n=1 Tax=Sabulicella glaciei TaxID=2984948 RepID=A0ABT3NTX3_9PROT|nr:error-prone DNA polymerase [Roseococcus sp. MDT2-1-1]MCW8085617.1 error-prone DNA polymerase [Roseococcus sp. MDT2-1-1]
MSYAEVAARSNFSFLDGASHPEELAEQARALGLAGMGICDTNGLAGVVRGHAAAKAAGLSFIVGCRLELTDGSAWLAWPTSRDGYGRLTALLSRGRMRAGKNQPDLSRAEMMEEACDWVLARIPPARLDRAFVADHEAAGAVLRGRLALPLLLAAGRRMAAGEAARLDRLARLGPLLATGEVRYHDRARRPLADVLTAIRLGTTVEALGFAAEPNAERHLKPPGEMAHLFARHPEALANTLRVLEAGRGFSLDVLRYEYPDEVMEPGRTPQETLEARVEAALAERWPDGAPEGIRRRIDEELRLIAQLGYAPYFLTVHEIVRFARAKDILCQGRGSAANSAVCYVLGITAVDPEKHDLLFERFVSASRDEPPDIDIDFEHERREEVIQHLYERYGRDRAAICATLIRYRPRSAIREVGKAMGLSEDVTARLAKASWGPGRESSFAELAAREGMDPEEPRLRMTLALAEELIGFPRHTATHVGGFVITRGKLTELAVVGRAAMDGRTVLEWDKDDIDALGMLKVDVLGLGMLTCLRKGFDLLRRHRGLALTLHGMPRDCPDTYAMLRRADSLGVFQVESRAQMNMLPRLKPRCFYDLVIQVAIVRPGPIQGDMVHPFLRRRQEIEKPDYPPRRDGQPNELAQVLGKTLGVPLFQEQAMKVAIVAAGFTPDEADQLRRAMATFKLTGGVSKYRDKLVEGMVWRGYDAAFAERVFSQIEGFGSYGFPESHAASFAHLVYASSWIKCHHPAIFACALLNAQPMGFYAPAQIVRDAREHGVEVRPVDVNRSAWDCAIEDEAALRLGLRLVTGLAKEAGEAVARARHSGNGAPFANVEEVARRARLDRKAMSALAAADAFRSLGAGRREAAWDAKAVMPELPLLADIPLPEPAIRLPQPTEGEAVAEDYRATGLTLGRHPLALLRPLLDAEGWGDTKRLNDLPAGRWLRLPGLVLMRQRPGSAKGVVFLTVEDEHGVGNLVVYEVVAARDRAALVGARLLLAEGRVEREAQHAEVPITHLIVRRLTDISPLLDRLSEDGTRWAERTLGHADEVRRPEPGARVPKRLGRSRDFH